MNIVEMIKSIYELCWAGPSWGPGEGNTFPLLFTMTCFRGGQTNPNNYCRLAMRTSRPHHAEIVLQGQANTLEYHFLSKQKSVQRWARHSAVKEFCRLDPWPGCCHPRATVIIRLCSQELVSNKVDYTLQGDKPHTHIEAAVSRP